MATDLLRLREFIADLARLAEAIVMYDADESAWAARNSLSSREVTAWFAPTRIGSRTEKPAAKAEQCEVRAQAAEWIAQLKQKYGATLVEWIDTGVGTEKPALVLKMRVVLESEEKRDVVLVAWRGSKTWQDWYYTDFSCRALRLQHDPKQRAWRSSATETTTVSTTMPAGAAALDDPEAPRLLLEPEEAAGPKLIPRLAPDRSVLVAQHGAWRAYGGKPGRSREGLSPRMRVKLAVERALEESPGATLVTTGHSLGGSLAILNAYDLLSSSAAARTARCTCITFGGNRFVNAVFKEAVDSLLRRQLLVALRVSIAGDLVPRLPLYFAPAARHCKHAIGPRLLLAPRHKVPLEFAVDDLATNRDLFWHWPDPSVHVHHEAYLAAQVLPGYTCTVPADVAWPLPQAYVDAVVERSAGVEGGDAA